MFIGSATAAEVVRLRDEMEELRAAAGSEELLRLRDAVTALTAKSTKERARSKKLYGAPPLFVSIVILHS